MAQDLCRQVETPELNLIVDECGGKKVLTECMIVNQDFPEINVHKGDSLIEVLEKLIEAHNKNTLEITFYKRRIDELIRQMNL